MAFDSSLGTASGSSNGLVASHGRVTVRISLKSAVLRYHAHNDCTDIICIFKTIIAMMAFVKHDTSEYINYLPFKHFIVTLYFVTIETILILKFKILG